MFLKIKWMSHENLALVDEMDLFIEADQVSAHSWKKNNDEMNEWPPWVVP